MKYFRTCPICNTEFTSEKKTKTFCSRNCVLLNYRSASPIKTYKLEVKKVKIPKKVQRAIKGDIFYENVSLFLHQIKSKAYFISPIDILRLLDIHAQIFPNDFHIDNIYTPGYTTREEYINKMFIDTMRWYKKESVKRERVDK